MFCSLKASSADERDEYSGILVALCSLALELKVHPPHSSVSPHRTTNHPTYVPGFHLKPACTLRMFQFFDLRCVTEFQKSKFWDSWDTDKLCSPGGASHYAFAISWLVPGKWSHDLTVVYSLCQNRAENRHQDPLFSASILGTLR